SGSWAASTALPMRWRVRSGCCRRRTRSHRRTARKPTSTWCSASTSTHGRRSRRKSQTTSKDSAYACRRRWAELRFRGRASRLACAAIPGFRGGAAPWLECGNRGASRGSCVDEQVSSLANAAGAAAAAGRWQEAERLWGRVHAIAPDNVQALFSLGVHAFQRGDTQGALELLQQARARAPRDPMILLTIGRVYREAGQPEQEWGTVIAALEIDPYFLPALLGKAEFLERQRKSRAAAAAFRDVLKVAPPEPEWPAPLRRRLAHAQEAVERDTQELVDFLAHRVAASRATIDQAHAARWDEAVSILAGRTRPYHSHCNQLHVPRLPAITFYDDALFPWMPELESRTPAIKAELQEMLASKGQE